MNIIPCTEEYLPYVVQIERECFSGCWSEKSLRDEMERGRVFVAFDGMVIGYIIAWTAADECEIAKVAVTKSSRRKGIADALIDFVLQTGAEKFFLEVREGNTAARALYRKHGFSEYGRRKNYYRAPEEDAVLLKYVSTGI